MKHIKIGGLEVSRLGLGTMAMSVYYLDPKRKCLQQCEIGNGGPTHSQ